MRKAFFIILIALFLISILFPFYWMLISSTKSFKELFAETPVFFPEKLSGKAFENVLLRHNFLVYIKNSFVVTSFTVVFTVFLGILGAYSIARLKFKGKKTLSKSILLIYMIPAILLLVPLYAILSRIGLIGTLSGLILTYIAQTLPVALYIFINYFQSIPEDLEYAAMVDGCSRFQVIRKIVFPLSIPSVVAVGLYTFIIAWNEFLYAYILLSDQQKFTLPIGLVHLYTSYHTSWDKVMAASTIIVVPVMLLFFIFERYLQKGLTAGAIKQ